MDDTKNFVSADGMRFLDIFPTRLQADMKANITLIGAIIAFTAAAYFKDIDKYIEKEEKG
ncbi:hypothetical protein [Bacillus atrophaeus]|uniref:hypothetical protein n=1 Tax=Bacillus atrophaeus TaxID=1452 RepID=UPI0022825474|nr:hypothetical protein [Bacillus atrophaeus]MCY9204381.1 hypothetical protein [Bacillus atrophaeus]MEC0885323.1 hypothetical protein [Bacillus atrophaeus]